jgi:enamine deaminase RidA (YjgF/YER057c/UK114 family)
VGDAYGQTVRAFRNVETALASAGAALADVVQTQMFVTDIGRWEDYGRAHGELFGDIKPVTAMLGVTALLDPDMLVEVTAVAYRA